MIFKGLLGQKHYCQNLYRTKVGGFSKEYNVTHRILDVSRSKYRNFGKSGVIIFKGLGNSK